MRMKFRSLLCAGLAIALLLPSLAFAADVPAGLRIPARFTQDVKGDNIAVSYEVTEDVADKSGTVIIPKGSTGAGRVVQYKSPNGWGGPGKTEVSLDNVTVGGRVMTVDSKATKYGGDNRFGSIFFFGVWGFFSKGGSGKVGTTNTLVFDTK